MNQPANDEELVSLAQAGDKAAFARLVARYDNMVLRIALRMVGDIEIARDLTQEAILQAYLSLDKLREQAQFQSWFYGIVLNLCRNYRRNRKVNFLSLEALAGGLPFDLLPFTANEPDPHTLAEMRELHETVLAAVATLSAKNRQATLLFYYEGLSLQEIAAALGITVTSVKGRLYKARQQLRELLVAFQPRLPSSVISQERKTVMIPVTIADLIIQEESSNRIVVLLDEAGRRLLPIWIGPFEADSIALHLLNHAVPRPLTYDFMAKVLAAASLRLEEVRIEALHEDTFYAIAKLRNGDTVHEIDARPSDAIALALRMNSPILVAEAVMDKSSTQIPSHVQTVPLHKGLDALVQQFAEKKKELEQTLEERKVAQANRSQAEQDEHRQKLLAYLFGDESSPREGSLCEG